MGLQLPLLAHLFFVQTSAWVRVSAVCEARERLTRRCDYTFYIPHVLLLKSPLMNMMLKCGVCNQGRRVGGVCALPLQVMNYALHQTGGVYYRGVFMPRSFLPKT